jgi:hypothetical protein
MIWDLPSVSLGGENRNFEGNTARERAWRLDITAGISLSLYLCVCVLIRSGEEERRRGGEEQYHEKLADRGFYVQYRMGDLSIFEGPFLSGGTEGNRAIELESNCGRISTRDQP